jgi:hypothetical protein
VKIIPVLDEELTMEVHIAHLDDGDLSPAARAFLKILEEEKGRPGREPTKNRAPADF